MATTFDDLGSRPAGVGWGWIIAYGALSVALGIMAFLWPFSATYAATIVIGAFFLAAGAISLISGIAGHGHEGRLYAILFGVVSILIGLLLWFEPATGALSLTLLVAIWLGARGVLEIGLGARMRRGKGMMIGLGTVNIVLAVIVVATLPWSALTLPGYILGISFLFSGIAALVSGINHRKGTAAFAVPA